MVKIIECYVGFQGAWNLPPCAQSPMGALVTSQLIKFVGDILLLFDHAVTNSYVVIQRLHHFIGSRLTLAGQRPGLTETKTKP